MNSNLILNDLAERMAINVLNISCLDEILSKSLINLIFHNTLNVNNLCKQRIIIVTGAGASFNACKAFKLGGEVAQELKKYYINKTTSWRKKNSKISNKENNIIEEEIKHLSTASRLNENEFETILFAIYKFFPNDLINKISKIYDHRYHPSLFYELVAHLLNHRFIDAVINFNFDELLDRSIDDELINEDYIKVISDGNVPEMMHNLYYKGHLKTPLYIKPHGTVSFKSTLRFTEEHYYGLPVDIKNLISHLLSGVRYENGAINDVTVNIIITGFAMKSFEFLEILSTAPKSTRIYWFDVNRKAYNDFIQSEVGEKFKNTTYFINISIVGLDKIFKNLYSKIQTKFKGFKQRGINRHELIPKLFKRNSFLKKNQEIKYLENRLKFELLFSIAKYKGFVTMRQLSKDRSGIYYNLYKEAIEKYNKKPKSFLKFISGLGLKDWSYSREALQFKVPHGSTNSLTCKEEDFYEFIKNLENISPELFNKHKKEVYNTLHDLLETADTEVNSRFKNVFDNQFLDPKLINTQLSLDIKTEAMMKSVVKNPNNTVLLVVAESGKWIIKYLKKITSIRKLQLMMIVADEVYNEELNKLINQKCNSNSILSHLSWWSHNQHMTLFIKKDIHNKIKFLNNLNWGIYLSRRMRGSNINPVIIKGNDLKPVIETFFAYLLKSGVIVNNIKVDPNLIVKSDVLKVTRAFRNNKPLF